MTLVPITELLKKYGISRGTYHYLLNRGVLPHYHSRFGEPGKKGARYLYDMEEFDAAWEKYQAKKRRGVGVNVVEREEKAEAVEKMPKHARVEFILENVVPEGDESLTQYEARIGVKREELLATDDAVILAQVEALFAQGFKPRSMR